MQTKNRKSDVEFSGKVVIYNDFSNLRTTDLKKHLLRIIREVIPSASLRMHKVGSTYLEYTMIVQIPSATEQSAVQLAVETSGIVKSCDWNFQ